MIHFLDESFIIAVCFVILIYMAYRPVKKSIIASLDARIDEIKTKLAETEKIKKDAKSLLEEIEQEMDGFEEHKKNIMQSSQISTENLIQTRKKEMDLMLSRSKDSALKSIEAEQVKASNKMSAEFTKSVLNTVRAYLVETKNNSVSDEEIMNHFIK